MAPAGDRDRVELDRAEPAEDLEHAVGPPSRARAGPSRWWATRNRRAASAVTFIVRDATVRQEAAYSRKRGTASPPPPRPRLARGGGPRERRTTERHHLRDRDGGRSAARGDIQSARRRRLVPLGARQRRDGGGPDRECDVRPWRMDCVGDRDSLRRHDRPRRRSTCAPWRSGCVGRRGAATGEPALFRGSVVPALTGEPIVLYARGKRGCRDARGVRRHLPAPCAAPAHTRPVRGPVAARLVDAGAS